MQVNWTGVFPAVATQMNEDGSDRKSTRLNSSH